MKSIQPDCLVSGRIGNRLGDYITSGDNRAPVLPLFDDWEAPATLNGTWGYKHFDDNWKSAKTVINLLLAVNSRGGNYLLNVGPDGKGRIPQPSVDTLREVGEWVEANKESIYATSAAPIIPCGMDGIMFTHKPGRLFMHILDGKDSVKMPVLGDSIKQIRVLSTGEEVEFSRDENSSGFSFQLPESQKKEFNPVVCLELEEQEKLGREIMFRGFVDCGRLMPRKGKHRCKTVAVPIYLTSGKVKTWCFKITRYTI